MRSALLAVDGVVRAQVSFEGREASVDYDPARCTVADLIAAVAAAKDPLMPVTFQAVVKQ